MRRGVPIAIVVGAMIVVAVVAAAVAWPRPLPGSIGAVPGGSPGRGADEIARAGCDACHTIPGIAGADSLVGPPLEHWSLRSTIGGHTSNTPEHLIAWLLSPSDIDPGTDMPDLDLTERQARDIAAYLFTLR